MATKDLLQGVEVVLLDIGKIPLHEPLSLGEVRERVHPKKKKMSGESSPQHLYKRETRNGQLTGLMQRELYVRYHSSKMFW